MATVVTSRTDNMPGYHSLHLDDVSSPSSDYSYSQGPIASGMYSCSSTVPLSDHLGGSSWDMTEEGTQNFHTFPGEDYSYAYAPPTPPMVIKKDPLDSGKDFRNKCSSSARESAKRVQSRSPVTVSSKRRNTKDLSNKGQSRIAPAASQMSRGNSVVITGNTSSYHRSGVHPNGALVEVNHSPPYLDSDQDAIGPAMYYRDHLHIDLDMGVDMTFGDMTTMHVDPSRMLIDPEASLAGNSPTNSWTFTPPQSPPDGYYTTSPISELANSPSDYTLHSDSHSHGYTMNPQHLTSEELAASMVADNTYQVPQSLASRRPRNEGESARDARDDPLYKNAHPKADGLFHCPWEGAADCHHKPEKLKCNYDKFVDSHLRPYRCKVEACESARFSSTACLLRHEREAHRMHGHQVYQCAYEGCERSLEGKGFPRAWNLKDHMRRVHNDNGTPPQAIIISGSPVSANTSDAQQSKSKRRSLKTSSSSGRKSSKSGSIEEYPDKAEEHPSYEQWDEHRRALEDLVGRLQKPTHPESRYHLKKAQKRLEEMYRLYDGYGTTSRKSSSSTRKSSHGD